MGKLFFSAVLLAAFSPLFGAGIKAPGDESADIDILINARLQLRDGKVEQAEQSTRDFLQKHPASAQAHFLLGFILFKEGQAKGAVDSTQEKIRSSLAEYTEGGKYSRPSSLDLKIVALDYVLLGDFADADTWLARSILGNANDPESWYYLGRVKESERNFPEAARAFERCLKLDPLNTRAEEAKKRVLEAEQAAH